MKEEALNQVQEFMAKLTSESAAKEEALVQVESLTTELDFSKEVLMELKGDLTATEADLKASIQREADRAEEAMALSRDVTGLQAELELNKRLTEKEIAGLKTSLQMRTDDLRELREASSNKSAAVESDIRSLSERMIAVSQGSQNQIAQSSAEMQKMLDKLVAVTSDNAALKLQLDQVRTSHHHMILP
jgi:chromosome segregation ATPase